MAKLLVVLALHLDARVDVDAMFQRMNRAIAHLKHELQIICKVEMEFRYLQQIRVQFVRLKV